VTAWFAAWRRLWNEWRRRRASARFTPGAVLNGRYEIVRPLGEGSYGLAYLCRDRQAGGTPCVVKHVRPLRGGGRAKAEAAHGIETAMLERLRHPAIPRLLEKFEQRGAYLFAMEYAPGRSLEQLLFEEDRVYKEEEALALLRRLLDIVRDVHEAGIVHRDIRIANVVADGDRLRLIDFGLARELRGRPADGTPDDVEPGDPPEKLLRRRIDVTSDFYALGHLLLFLLYSAYPEDDAAEERSWEEELTSLAPATKRLLRRLLMAEQPYGSAREAAEDVDAALRACAERRGD